MRRKQGARARAVLYRTYEQTRSRVRSMKAGRRVRARMAAAALAAIQGAAFRGPAGVN